MHLEILTKISFALFLVVLSFIADWKVNLVLVLFLFLLGSLQIFFQPEFSTNRRTYRRFLAYAWSALLLITVLNGIFLREGAVVLDAMGIAFYENGLEFGLITGSRLAVISFSLFLFFITTPLRKLIEFFQQVGLPGQLTFILFLTLHFIVQIPERISQIYTAQESRGAPVKGHVLARARAFFSILFPLVLSSISETLERGSALELRGFRGELATSSLVPYTLISRLTAFLMFVATIALIVYAILR
jgi:energy-coupling factor transport system permease protein